MSLDRKLYNLSGGSVYCNPGEISDVTTWSTNGKIAEPASGKKLVINRIKCSPDTAGANGSFSLRLYNSDMSQNKTIFENVTVAYVTNPIDLKFHGCPITLKEGWWVCLKNGNNGGEKVRTLVTGYQLPV